MLTLHHLENSQSFRILWLLEELGVDYELRKYDRDPATKLATADYKRISPLGTAPVITDGDLTLSETNAIVDHILDTRGDGRLRPAPGKPERARYLFWFHAAQGSLSPLLTNIFVFGMMKSRVPFFLKPLVRAILGKVEKLLIEPRQDRLLALIERDLGETTWFAGEDLTAADIVMGYSMEVAALRAGMDSRFPNAQRFLEQMRARPAYKAALEKDGKFQVLG